MDLIIEILFEVGNPLGQLIVYLIIGLLVIGFLKLLHNGLWIYRQNGFMQTVTKRFASLKSNFEEISVERQDGKSSKDQSKRKKNIEQKLQQNKEELIKDIPGNSIIARRIEDLLKVRYVGELAYESLKEHLYTEEMEKTGLSRYLASIFILLGLIGTVLGLSQSVINLEPLLSKLKNVTDLAAISHAIAQTLSGMKTAFSATIAGIAATVLLTFMNFLFGRYSASFINKLENFTTLYLIPYFLVPTTEEASIRFADTVSKGAEALDRSTNPLLKVSKKLDGSVNKVDNLLKTLAQIGNKYDQAVDKLTTAQKELIDAQKKNEDRLEKTSSNYDGTLKRFQEDTAKLFDGTNESIKQLVKDVAENINKAYLENMKDTTQSSMENINESLKANKNETQKLLLANKNEAQELLLANKNEAQELLLANKNEAQKLLKAQFDKETKVINNHEKMINKYSEIANNTVKIYDMVSFAINGNHHKEMAQREERLIKSIEGLAINLRDIAGEVCTRSGNA